jgi:ferric-dicitrate binding protein FerR (iron transport regulator)
VSRHVAPHRLAGALSARERRHLEGCPRCVAAQARVLAARITLADVALAEPAELSPAAEARAEASIRWTRVPVTPVVRRPFLVGLGLAAAAAAALVVWDARAPHRAAYASTTAPTAHHAMLPPRPDRLEALVTLVGGEVELARGDTPAHKLGLDVRLGAADRLTTRGGGRAAAQWSEGSGFLLDGDAELTLARLEPRTQRLELGRGQISVRVGPHEPGESLQVITPDHVVSVHGTWFTVASSAHTTTVEVLEGTVAVSERDGANSTLLTAPARAVFGHGRTASSPLSGREAARLRAVSEMNLLPWTGLEAAAAGSGDFAVASQPPAELAVDGIVLGATPLAVRRPLGRHYIELTRADFRPLHQWITVGREPGELRAALVHAPPVVHEEESAPVEIESMVRRRGAQIRACYERRLKRDPSLAGTVTLRLRVGDAGQVTRVDVEGSTLPDPLVADCLRHEAAGWSFTQGRNATVVYPFVFRSQ